MRPQMESKRWGLVIKCCRKFCSKPLQQDRVAKEKAIANLLYEDKANWTKEEDEDLRRNHDQLEPGGKTVTASGHDEWKQLLGSRLESTNEPHYYYQNGLQKVYPYYYNFSTYVKRNWLGRNILDVYSTAFHKVHPGHARKMIEEGKVRINGEPVNLDFILKQNQILETYCHRHEKPVKQVDLEILGEDNDVLVVNKPCSWPTLPCGQYNKNSLYNILKKQYGYTNLYPVYRLDMLTSGVLICAKNLKTAQKLFTEIKERRVQKEYVARVMGHFPDGVVECSQPLLCVSRELKIYRVDPGGRESLTTFERLSYNGKTSVVKCMPHTGRTHQIRLHLQYLGYPIVNDVDYGPEAFGRSITDDGVYDDLLAEREQEISEKFDVADLQENLLYKKKLAAVNQRKLGSNRETIRKGCDDKAGYARDRTVYESKDKSALDLDVNGKLLKSSGSNKVAVIKDYDEETMFKAIDVYCLECNKDLADPTEEDLIMYLHAYRYKGSDWDYNASLPDWAHEDWPE